MHDKLPEITQKRRNSRLQIEDVSIEFEEEKLPPLLTGVIANQAVVNHTEQECVDEDDGDDDDDGDDEDDDEDSQVCEASKGNDGPYCNFCAEKAAMDTGKLTEKVMELKLEIERHNTLFETTKRKLDNTYKELKTAQAMIETLKAQNTEKANRIANLTREATIGLWNREKKKLLQFADVREASLECELESLKSTSSNFKDRALDRIQFLHDQVYKFRLQLDLQKSGGQISRLLDTAEKKLNTTKEQHRQELDAQKEEFFKFRKNMVGMLAGFHKDFSFLTNTVDAQTYEANADFFDLAEQFESMIGGLHKSALNDKLGSEVEKMPAHIQLSEGMTLQNRPNKHKENTGDQFVELVRREVSMTEEDMIKKLKHLEDALYQSSKELHEFDENIPELETLMDINDSGISLNEYESSVAQERRADSALHSSVNSDTPDKSVRFQQDIQNSDVKQHTEGKWKKRRRGAPLSTSDKSVQVELLTATGTPLSTSRKGKRSKKTRPRSNTPLTRRKPTPKKLDGTLRAEQEQEVQKQWIASRSNMNKKHSSPDLPKSRQNNMTFTHLRELYAEKRGSCLIDRGTGTVDIVTANRQFPNLTKDEIVEGFTQFVLFDCNNDYRLDLKELVRAISRTTEEVIEPEEMKLALFELGVLESDELDFFDFLCIQETLTTGIFDKSRSKMLRLQGPSKRSTVSKYCTIM